MGFERLKDKVQAYLPAEKLPLLEEAYDFASEAHKGQLRLSGEPYIEHPLETALILAELQLDTTSLQAALLHDVIENCGIPVADIEARFGPDVARLVDGVTRIGKLTLQVSGEVEARHQQAENLRKMLVAMAEDLRVVFIKLADRLHNMRTLSPLPPEKQRHIAEETLEIYAPLSHRLGIWELKWQLEDLSFRYLQPERYRMIAKMVATRREVREKFIAQVVEVLKNELERLHIQAEVSGRPKHIYSIHQKMEKYAAMGKTFDTIYDLLALRVLVGSVTDCYSALGAVHNLWHPLPEGFDDFIANPKPNGYKSLHTVVMCMGVTPLEVQIRTREMHHVAEYGVAAHWRYKEGEKTDMHFEDRIAWLRQLVEWRRELSGAEEFLESVKTDIFIGQVFVFTPKGEIKDLPKGSTPLDFAYRLHTELGHRCIGAKVNGRLVPLNYNLNNGDVVEIITSKRTKGPSTDWLSPQLGYVKTSQARTKIRQWFTKRERVENIERGKELLEKELRRLGIKFSERDELAKQFKYDSMDDFLAAIGDGSITTHQIAVKLATEQEEKQPKVTGEPTAVTSVPSIQVLGVEDVLTNLAQCCHPVPGDSIIGYITRSRGVTIHRTDCRNIVNEEERERLVPVEWGYSGSVYPATIQVDAWDRVGLMRDITTLVAEEKVNIASVSLTGHGDHTTSIFLTLETTGLSQLSRLLAKMEGIRGVIGVTRVGGETPAKSSSSA
ncbi:MAG: bifunctional (p)ppGpp synthetase/guanosine-3',5'-bis(diphosphate) 3'-pyrophosphohydrolase [Chloroflexi bacterium]|nr:bifunctional (p)ppGpp synthetase/guanosine-3',5'-bis(diphosphate) 3'-pyrophosphohydrolase [Chloroflexota bacterium]